MTFKVVIPARHASTRLPGKPLRLIAGKPMIQWVVDAAQASAAEQVWVATDDERIHECVRSFGGNSIMTSSEHSSGTDRLQEAAKQLGFADDDCVVNVQGDEPLIPPAVINQVAENLGSGSAFEMATLCEPITSRDEYLDPNAVKVVFSEQGQALYFSRAPIPMQRDANEHSSGVTTSNMENEVLAYRHIGLYAYKVQLLHRFVSWPVHSLEHTEKLEQLRALGNDVQIHIARSCQSIPAGVDCEADLQRVEQRLLNQE